MSALYGITIGLSFGLIVVYPVHAIALFALASYALTHFEEIN